MTKFTCNEKYEAVRLYMSGKQSYADIAREMGVAKSSVRKWVALYQAHGREGLISTYTKKQPKKTQPAEGSKEALVAELEYLRAENAYLKKLNALVQEKEKLQNKTSRK